jgi:acyl-CoA reductase-like NAD-dependent aldehyde dehydrogenase
MDPEIMAKADQLASMFQDLAGKFTKGNPIRQDSPECQAITKVLEDLNALADKALAEQQARGEAIMASVAAKAAEVEAAAAAAAASAKGWAPPPPEERPDRITIWFEKEFRPSPGKIEAALSALQTLAAEEK